MEFNPVHFHFFINIKLFRTKKNFAIIAIGSLVYDRNHYFSFGPIPKPKLVIVSADTVTDAKTTFQRETLVTNSMGISSIIKETLKPNLLPNFQDF